MPCYLGIMRVSFRDKKVIWGRFEVIWGRFEVIWGRVCAFIPTDSRDKSTPPIVPIYLY
jgi:hypothetical protein